ncbi:MAG TPA: phosphoglucosamine mutase [Pyrinomonadaceae bacterium]|nr:phosphoglucosamine mutase [Pyrinomonadaceae bacterium]
MEKLFGTDGIRGHAGSFPLDTETVREIGRSLAKQFTDRLGRVPRFVTGRDTRESGESIEAAFHSGATEAGAQCRSAGVITTPGVAYLTGRFEFDAGIVISASHNPYEDNGIKIFSPDGKKIDEPTERAIERDIHASQSSNGTAQAAIDLDTTHASEYQDAYLAHLENEVDGLRLDGLRLAVDCANGAASHLAPDLLRRLGAEVIVFNDQPDGRNINLNCGSLHLDQLQAKVVEEKADFGVAFDGDADRALFVDESGMIVDGDATLWVMSRFMKDSGQLANGKVVATVMSNIGLELALSSIGLELVRTAVGDKYVLDELLRSDSELGGEQSGHVIFPRESLVGDGMMTSLFMLQAMRSRGAALSKMTEGFVRYPQTLVNVKVREKRPFDDVAAIASASRSIENELAGKGRLLLRYSGTENLARVMIEGQEQAEIERQANGLAEVIKANLG